MTGPRIVARRRTVLSPWFTVTEQDVARGDRVDTFHAIDQADYVTVLAISPEGDVPLVSQFRPALDRITTELPGGLLDAGEEPVICALRELAEEVGLEAVEPAILLGKMAPDTGRLQNRLWAYFVPKTRRIAGWQPEPGVAPLTVSRDELLARIDDGRFDHALHIAIVGLAFVKRLI